MTSDLSNFAARLRKRIQNAECGTWNTEKEFNSVALELFALQFFHNEPYQKFCNARGASPQSVSHWNEIPAVPTSAFKELELSCLPTNERTNVFHSSGTTEQKPSRHFHNTD